MTKLLLAVVALVSSLTVLGITLSITYSVLGAGWAVAFVVCSCIAVSSGKAFENCPEE